jgi:hypothetical protein
VSCTVNGVALDSLTFMDTHSCGYLDYFGTITIPGVSIDTNAVIDVVIDLYEM